MTGKTLKDALALASQHWRGRPGEVSMTTFAAACVNHLGEARELKTLETKDGVALLDYLRNSRRLAPKSVVAYYGAFRRMLALAGIATTAWPKAPTPPRRTRDPMSVDDLAKLIRWLDNQRPRYSTGNQRDWKSTADLARLIRGTGLRVNIEALTEGRLTVTPGGPDYTILHVTGKGDNERELPVVDAEARAVLFDLARMKALRETPYRTHLDRWKKGVKELGITSRLATPHSVRHSYASDALDKSGGNLSMVQELLGHADPATTARYLQTDLAAKARALSAPQQTGETTKP
jgi:integrase